MSEREGTKSIRAGIIGYGPAFNMGKAHMEYISQTEGLEAAAVCDLDPKRTEAAKQDFPGIQTYNDIGEMLREADIDLAVIVTPHNTHAELAIQCVRAGRHVVVEKPMCITASEATSMIEAAKEAGVMLSVFQNRRWDGDYLTIKELVQRGLIGDLFHVELFSGSYRHPGYWWRSDKKVSGGAFYDWGAHLIDWLLNLVPGRVVSVTGFVHKLVWHDVTNEDQVQAVLRFESGAVGDVQLSHIARAPKPRWRILGTKGAIVDRGGGSLTMYTELNGLTMEAEVKHKDGNWLAYYANIAGHLLRGEPLAVTPESARRVIAIMEAAEKSAKTGRTEPVPYE